MDADDPSFFRFTIESPADGRTFVGESRASMAEAEGAARREYGDFLEKSARRPIRRGSPTN